MRLVGGVRAGEWWEHKLGVAVTVGYATASLAGGTLAGVRGALLVVLAALVPDAAYVSLVNDLTDRTVDAAAGKRTIAHRLSPGAMRGAIALCLLLGVGIALMAWRRHPLALALYAGSWLSFTLYSCPPLRLKTRGLAGPLSDAIGAHVLPQLLMVVAVLTARGRTLDVTWMAIVAAWALAHGLSGVLWHQLDDVEADRRAGITTFVTAHVARARHALGLLLAFELVAFVVLAVHARAPIVALMLVPYLPLAVVRVRDNPMSGRAKLRLVVEEYYLAVAPVMFLVVLALHHPAVWLWLGVHLTVFHTVPLGWLRWTWDVAPRLPGRIVIATRRRGS